MISVKFPTAASVRINCLLLTGLILLIGGPPFSGILPAALPAFQTEPSDDLSQRILDAELELQTLQVQMGSKHPKVVQAAQTLDFLREKLNDRIATSQSSSSDDQSPADPTETGADTPDPGQTGTGIPSAMETPATAQPSAPAAIQNSESTSGRLPLDAEQLGIDRQALQGCELHVVGMYAPENSNTDDRLYVHVKKTDRPMVLVLTGYFGAQWHLKIDPDAQIRHIIVAGYFKHEIAEPPPNVPVTMLTYFGDSPAGKTLHFWAYAWHTAEGRELRKHLKNLTGLDVTTFQGQYSARHFVVDGKLGRDVVTEENAGATSASADQQSTSQTVLETAPESRPESRSAGTNQSRTTDITAKMTPADREAGRQRAERISRNAEEASLLAAQAYHRAAEQESASPQVLSELKQRLQVSVRAAFDAQMQLQKIRLLIAQQDLANLWEKHERRGIRAEQIIQHRVDGLLGGEDLKWQQSSSGSAADRSLKTTTTISADQPAKQIGDNLSDAAEPKAAVGPAADLSLARVRKSPVEGWLADIRALGSDAAEKRQTALNEITAALMSADTAMNLAATQVLAQTGDVTYEKSIYRDRLLVLCRSSNPQLAISALYALYNTDRKADDLQLAQEVLSRPEAVTAGHSISHLLKMFGDGKISGRSEDIVLTLLNSTDRNVRREALRGLWGAATSDRLMDRVIELVDSEQSHNDAIYFALSTCPDKNAAVVNKLIEVLSDPDWNNWDRAIWGLGYGVPESQQPAVAEALLQMFDNRNDPRTREKCARLIKQYGEPHQIEKLTTLQSTSAEISR